MKLSAITSRSLGILILLLGLAGGGGCATDRSVIDQAAGFHNTLEPAVMEDPVLADYMQRVGERIITAAREYHASQADKEGESRDWMFSQNMKFHLVNSKTLNAFTTGGEHMYIYNQLFQEAKSEDELAAVMAHEYAHVYGRHIHKGMDRQYALLGAAAAAGVAGYAAGGEEKGMEYAGLAAGAALVAGQFVGMSYTRGDESEADKYGFMFYARAGWDPDKFGDFFAAMIEKGYDKGPEFLSDHPLLSTRLKTAQERADKLPASAQAWRRAPVAGASQFRSLQKRAEQLGRTMPSDQTLANASEILDALPRSCFNPTITPDQKAAEQRVLLRAEQARKQRATKQ